MKFMYRFAPSNTSGIWAFQRLVYQYSGKKCLSSDQVLWMNISYSIVDNSEDTYTFRRVNGSFQFVDALTSYCIPLSANQEHSINDWVCTGFPENENVKLNLTELLNRNQETLDFVFSMSLRCD